MAKAPRASVVVPVRDGAAPLAGLLESLGSQTIPRRDFEVVVVDNGSRDPSARVARDRGARVVSEPVAGRARARNRGVQAASAERLAFTDADCTAAPGWLEALLECLERHDLAAGPVRLVTQDPPNRVERLESLWRFRQERSVREAGWAATANLGARRGAFERIGFDEAYRRIGEDVDFCLRARAAGLELGWCGGAEVTHPAESRLVPLLRRGFAHGWSSTQLERRLGPGAGRRYWRHPGPIVRGGWALERFADPQDLDPIARRGLMRLARCEYAARWAGSLWAEVRRVR